MQRAPPIASPTMMTIEEGPLMTKGVKNEPVHHADDYADHSDASVDRFSGRHKPSAGWTKRVPSFA